MVRMKGWPEGSADVECGMGFEWRVVVFFRACSRLMMGRSGKEGVEQVKSRNAEEGRAVARPIANRSSVGNVDNTGKAPADAIVSEMPSVQFPIP